MAPVQRTMYGFRFVCSSLLVVSGALAPAVAGNQPKPKEQSREAMAVAQAYNRTAAMLYPHLVDAGANAVFSPYSIGSAMAMAYAGAKNETRGQLAEALHLPDDSELVGKGNRGLLESINARSRRDGVTIRVANGLALARHGGMIDRGYQRQLEKWYDAELFQTSGVAAINAWVAKRTRGKIQSLLNQLPANPVCVLLNAVYFKGTWKYAFEEEKTMDRPFHLTADRVERVPTMERTADFRWVRRNGMTVVSLPYSKSDLRLLLLVPDSIGGLPAVEESLDEPRIQTICTGVDAAPRKRLRLRLPKFKLHFRVSLVKPFKELGIHDAFSASEADFGGMLGRDSAPGQVWISDVLHKAVIEVSEEGTAAAAATGVVTVTRSGQPEPPPELNADRPFAFLLTDRQTGAILFMGRVADPR